MATTPQYSREEWPVVLHFACGRLLLCRGPLGLECISFTLKHSSFLSTRKGSAFSGLKRRSGL